MTELPWSELDLDAGAWGLRHPALKNKRPHLVRYYQKRLPSSSAGAKAKGDYVFPAARRAYMEDENLSRPLKVICARLARIGLASFTTHDLRRTVETGMAAAKVPKEYRDRVLNHVDTSVGGVHYNMYDYADEKREALEKWTRRLEGMLKGPASNVVPL